MPGEKKASRKKKIWGFSLYERVHTQLCDLHKSHTHLRQPLATSGKFRRNWQTAPNAPKTCNLTWDDHRNPLRPKIQLGGAPRSCARTCQRLPEVAGAVPEVARAQMHLKRKFLHKVYVRLVWPKYRYRRGAIGPGYLLVPLVWSGGTRRPHIGLGQQINFNSHFRSKIGIVKKHPENPLLAPKHVAGAYKHHGTLKLCSESF